MFYAYHRRTRDRSITAIAAACTREKAPKLVTAKFVDASVIAATMLLFPERIGGSGDKGRANVTGIAWEGPPVRVSMAVATDGWPSLYQASILDPLLPILISRKHFKQRTIGFRPSAVAPRKTILR